MQYSTLIDNVTAQKWGLSIQQAYLFAWIHSLPTWADSVKIEGFEYYYCSKSKIITELPLLTDKPDTIYRHLKALQEKDLIDVRVDQKNKKQFMRLTQKGKEWGRTTSEKNPIDLGKKSDVTSEKNPTNHIISNNITISDIAETKVSAFKRCVELYDQFCKKRLNVGCKMNGAEGKSMKEIIKYLIVNSPNKSEDEAVLAFEHILADWDKLDKFLITQIRLTQINQNLPNIINVIRNGKSQSRGSTYEALEQLREMQRNFETSGSDSENVSPRQSSHTRHEPVNDIHRGRGFD